ncbi:MAG: extracellular solute-binding protein [Clostridia bacterium]
MKFKNKNIIIILIIISIVILVSFYLKNSKKKSVEDFSGEHLVVYSCLRGEETKAILELFKQKYNCSYEYIQLPTQEAIARIKDEKDSPKADVFLSGTGEGLKDLAKSNAIKKYISENDENVPDAFKGKDGKWIAFEAHPLSIVINKKALENQLGNEKTPIPTNFKDLTNPKYKGKIAMPNPLTSGTGYSFISYLDRLLGDDEYRKVISKIRDNTGILSTRGYNVVQNVASGEYPIGISYLNNIKFMEKTISDFIVITPKDTGVDIHGVGIINKATNTKVADEFVDFIISNNFQEKLKEFSTSIPIIKYNDYEDKYLIQNLDNKESVIKIWENS